MKVVTSYFGIALRYLCVFSLTALAFDHFVQEGFGRGDFLPLVFWGLPSILINSAVIFGILLMTKKIHFVVRFFVQFIGAVVLSYFAAVSYSFLLGAWAGALSVPPLPAHLAGAFAGSFLIQGWSKNGIIKFILNLCMYLLIIIFFGGGLYHIVLFINTEFRGGREIKVVNAKKIEKEFNNEQEIKNYYCSETMKSNDVLFAEKKDFCSPYNLGAFVELYNSKGVVFRSERASSYLIHFKKEVIVFLVFPDDYELSLAGEFFKIPKSDSIVYFHDGSKWDFFPKEVQFSGQQVAIRFDKRYSQFCISIEGAPGRFPGGCSGYWIR